MTSSQYLARRAFLARVGILGAAVGAGGLLPRAALAQPGNPLDDVVALLRPVLAKLATDTMNGLVVFVCPGPDEYSKAQGTPRGDPGALEADAARFLTEALDNFVPFPDELARPVTAALTTGLADAGIELPGLDALPNEVATLDKALGSLLRNDATIPLSLLIAGLLNLVATTVNPAAVNGPFVSPFARLSFDEKARAFEVIETPLASLVSTLDVQLPQPLSESVSGLLKFVGGALLEFAAFGSYGEYAVFDRETKQLTGRPVGWQLTGYQPDGPVEGWDEFIGYYQDRTEVQD
ncbi:hypothetical protein EV191_113123 [Tamaricihabitans halophyticus]|uniref:Uncharacterized protein n=1 Tax=Tamaricihabitans halophyticus TaxID=1262583 RepID=A0A4R2QEF4_9PSEU|nr:hypothetical protein [Tamaricihabitans halophyticus]TCP46844.1 hypothetical protein EV191_113123 [Tamaricihabitans halophyticus]